MGRNEHAAGTAGLGDLFHHDGVGEHVHAGAPVLFRQIAAEQAHLADLFLQSVRNGVILVDFRGQRLDLLVDEIPYAVLQHPVIL